MFRLVSIRFLGQTPQCSVRDRLPVPASVHPASLDLPVSILPLGRTLHVRTQMGLPARSRSHRRLEHSSFEQELDRQTWKTWLLLMGSSCSFTRLLDDFNPGKNLNQQLSFVNRVQVDLDLIVS